MQPKYFIKKIGGWVTFDLVYKNSIYVKFQNEFSENVKSIIEFLKSHTEYSTTVNKGFATG